MRIDLREEFEAWRRAAPANAKPNRWISTLAFDPRGAFLAVGLPGVVAVYDLRDGTRCEEYALGVESGENGAQYPRVARAVTFSEDGRRRLIELDNRYPDDRWH